MNSFLGRRGFRIARRTRACTYANGQIPAGAVPESPTESVSVPAWRADGNALVTEVCQSIAASPDAVVQVPELPVSGEASIQEAKPDIARDSPTKPPSGARKAKPGPKPADQSNGTALRARFVVWKQTPESQGTSLRGLAAELGTSHHCSPSTCGAWTIGRRKSTSGERKL
jgi:hypothetical protein